MRIGIILISTIVLFSNSVLAQKQLEVLLDERDSLYEKQAFLESKNSNFWGTKSKKDLRRMVENLEYILRKDNQIIAAIKRENFASRTNIIYKNRDTRTENAQLEAEISKYRNLNRKKIEELKLAMEDMEAYRSTKFNYEVIILVMFFTIIGLVIYTRRLSARLK